MEKLLKSILSSENVRNGWIPIEEIKNRHEALLLEESIIEIDLNIMIFSNFIANPEKETMFLTKNGITLEWDGESFYLECVGIDIVNFSKLKDLYKSIYGEELYFNSYDYWKYKQGIL